MNNSITKRIAIKAECSFSAPALIGSGTDNNTDSDIIRDSMDTPFIPGSSIAGVLRSYITDAEPLFGNGDEASPLFVYDSEFKDYKVIELDGVAIDYENKIAKDGAKYDFEAIDTGAGFDICLLLNIRKNDSTHEEKLKTLVGALKHGISLGAKTNRGFGRVQCDKVYCRIFDFTNETGLSEWINFDRRTDKEWKSAEYNEFKDSCSVLRAELILTGSIMIRDNRNISSDADYMHISSNGKPVIFGTSWAGAFRSGLFKMLKPRFDNTEAYIDEVFGKKSNDNKDEDFTVSKVVFCASFLEEINPIVNGYRSITRVKIDRFTGGAANGALFEEEPWYGGRTTLEIRYPKDRKDIEELILLGLCGIDRGMIQIGGEASIGRGFFKIESVGIDGVTKAINEQKHELIKAIRKEGEPG